MADDLVPYRSGMEYGIGIDSPSGDARNVGALGDPTTIPNAGGSIVEYELTQVSSDEDLQTSLGVSASASGGVGLFSASASMDFAQKCHVHSNSVFLLASVKVNLAFSQIREPAIKSEAAAKLADGDPTRFQEMYGDSFVRGPQTGGGSSPSWRSSPRRRPSRNRCRYRSRAVTDCSPAKPRSARSSARPCRTGR